MHAWLSRHAGHWYELNLINHRDRLGFRCNLCEQQAECTAHAFEEDALLMATRRDLVNKPGVPKAQV
jgi:hypothetical protein